MFIKRSFFDLINWNAEGGGSAGGQPGGGAPAGDTGAAGGEGGGAAAAALAPSAAGGAGEQKAAPGAAFIETVPEGPIRDLLKTKGYDDPLKLANAYYNANRVLGGATDVITIPGKDATPEQVAAFRTKLGVPEAPAGYEFDTSKVQNASPEMVEFAKGLFHDIGVPKGHEQKALEKWEAFVGEQNQKLQAQFDQRNAEEVAAIKQKMGAQADEFLANGQRAVKAMGLSNEALAKLEGSMGAGAVVELMGLIGKGLREGSFKPGAAASMDVQTPEQARTEIARLQATEAYRDAKHPEHAHTVKRAEQLFALSVQKRA